MKCAGQFNHKGMEAINEAREHLVSMLSQAFVIYPLDLGGVLLFICFHFVGVFFSCFERGGFEMYRIAHKILFLNQAVLWKQK